tara:strand:- start:1202 stop:2398 length:1197 start_codon:yes stop_codon:yes gene_type:complete
MKSKSKRITLDCYAVDPSQLHIGSLIFFYSKNTSSLVEHVAICVGFDDQVIPRLVHCVNGQSTNGVVETDLLSKYAYLVSTPRDKKLREIIVALAKSYARERTDHTRIPYDYNRFNTIRDTLKQHKCISPEKQLQYSNQQFIDYPLLCVTEVVKTAVRGNQPIRRVAPVSQKGMTCAHLVSLILQLALVKKKMSHAICPLSQLGLIYPGTSSVSIGHTDYGCLSNTVSGDFLRQYLEKLPASSTKDKTVYPNTIPAVAALGVSQSEIETNLAILQETLSNMPFLSKTMTAAALLDFVDNHSGDGGMFYHAGVIDPRATGTKTRIKHHRIKKTIDLDSASAGHLLNRGISNQSEKLYTQRIRQIVEKLYSLERLRAVSLFVASQMKPDVGSNKRIKRSR